MSNLPWKINELFLYSEMASELKIVNRKTISYLPIFNHKLESKGSRVVKIGFAVKVYLVAVVVL